MIGVWDQLETNCYSIFIRDIEILSAILDRSIKVETKIQEKEMVKYSNSYS